MIPQEKHGWLVSHLTKQAAPLSADVAQAAKAENYMRDTQHMFVRRVDQWTFYCHLCKKQAGDAHLASAAHRSAVEFSASISWMCGVRPRILRTPCLGAPVACPICQEMCRAWWGPRVVNMLAQAVNIFATWSPSLSRQIIIVTLFL